MTIAADNLISSRADNIQRFWNARLSFGWALAGVASLSVVVLKYSTVPGILAGVFAVYALQASFVCLLGVELRGEDVAMPRPISRWAPLLVMGRFRLPLRRLLDVTALGQLVGFECVGFTTTDKLLPVLFVSRSQRLAFFEAVKAVKPDIKIFRAI